MDGKRGEMTVPEAVRQGQGVTTRDPERLPTSGVRQIRGHGINVGKAIDEHGRQSVGGMIFHGQSKPQGAVTESEV